MKLRLFTALIGLFLTIALSPACKNEAGEPAEGEVAGDSAAVQQPEVKAVAWNALEGFIPKTAAGLPRTNAFEDKSSLGDLGFSHALGIYEKDKKRVEIQILDAGSKSVILSTMASWRNNMDLNEVYEEGSEKTFSYEGFPAIEKVDNKNKTADFNVVMKDRFIVMIHGEGVSLEELRKVMGSLDLKKLSEM